MAQTVTLQIPELLYQRLINTARATATLAVPTNHQGTGKLLVLRSVISGVAALCGSFSEGLLPPHRD